jgi:hypothetical protein
LTITGGNKYRLDLVSEMAATTDTNHHSPV